MEKSGAAVTGVVSFELLLPGTESAPFAPSSAIEAVLEICATPAATGFTTVTAKVAVSPLAPVVTPPMASVQVEPALLFGTHPQPAVLAPALNVEFAGTVSVSTTPVAETAPALPYVSV